VISARARGVSTVPVPLMVPGVQDPVDPDRARSSPRSAPVPRRTRPARGRAAGRTRSTAPFDPNWPSLAVAAELSMGVDARPEGPQASLGHLTKGELCREQALVFWCGRPSDTWGFKSLGTQVRLIHGGPCKLARRSISFGGHGQRWTGWCQPRQRLPRSAPNSTGWKTWQLTRAEKNSGMTGVPMAASGAGPRISWSSSWLVALTR